MSSADPNSDLRAKQGQKPISLSTDQMNKLRDAFQLIDQDSDGKISKEDLRKIFESVNVEKSEKEIERMFESSNGEDLSFTKYVTLISQELSKVSNKNEIIKAMKVFSEDLELDSNYLRQNLLKSGLKGQEIDHILNRFQTEKMNGDKMFMGKEFLNYLT